MPTIPNPQSFSADDVERIKKFAESLEEIYTLSDAFAFKLKDIANLEGQILEDVKKQNAIIEKQNVIVKSIFSKFTELNITGGKFVNTLKNLRSPAYAFFTLIELAGDRFMQLDAAAQRFREDTGLLASQTTNIENNVRSISRDFQQFGIDIEKSNVAAKSLTDVFGDQFVASNKENIKYISLMSANLGVSADDSAKILNNFMGIGNASMETSRYLSAQVVSLSKAAGVPLNKVMKEVANVSGDTLLSLRGNVTALIKASVEAMRLGTTLNNVGSAASKLLDFQTSINDEMEASVLLGKDLNLQRAREFAYAGDLASLANEQVRIINQIGDARKLDFFQQRALAQSLGLSVEEMNKMRAKQKELSDLRSYDPVFAAEYENRLKKINNLNVLSNKELKEKYKQELLTQQIQSQQNKLANQFKQLLVEISDILVPITKGLFLFANYIVAGLRPLGFVLNTIGLIYDAISKLWDDDLDFSARVDDWKKSFTSMFSDAETSIKTIVGALLLGFFALRTSLVGVIFNTLAAPFSVALGLARAFFTKVGLMKGIASAGPSGGASAAGKGIFSSIGSSVSGAAGSVPSKVDGSMGKNIKDFLTNLSTGIKSFNPVSEILKGLVGIAASGPAFLLFATSAPGLAVAALAGLAAPLITKGFTALSNGIRMMDIGLIGRGLIGIAAMGVSMIPFAYAMKLLIGVNPLSILASVGAIFALGAAAEALGAIFSTGVGAALFGAGVLGIAALGAAMIPFGYAAEKAGNGMKNFGIGIKDIAGNIKELIMLGDVFSIFKDGAIVEGINKMTEAMSKLNSQLENLSFNAPAIGELKANINNNGNNSPDNKIIAKLDELINLMANGGISVNIDGSKATHLLSRAQRERGAYGSI